MSSGSAPRGGQVPRFVPPGDDEEVAIRRDYLQFLKAVADQCGDIGLYNRGGSPVVLVSAPEVRARRGPASV